MSTYIIKEHGNHYGEYLSIKCISTEFEKILDRYVLLCLNCKDDSELDSRIKTIRIGGNADVYNSYHFIESRSRLSYDEVRTEKAMLRSGIYNSNLDFIEIPLIPIEEQNIDLPNYQYNMNRNESSDQFTIECVNDPMKKISCSLLIELNRLWLLYKDEGSVILSMNSR